MELYMSLSCSCIPTQLLFPARRTGPRTTQPTVTIHVTAQYLRIPAIFRFDVDVLELQARTRRRFRAINTSRDIVSTCARDVLPSHIADLQPTGIAVVVRVNAWGDVDGLVDVLEVDIAECNVTDKSLAWVRFDPSGIGAVNCLDIFEEDVLNIVRNRSGVA
jgi:hypothetical protein